MSKKARLLAALAALAVGAGVLTGASLAGQSQKQLKVGFVVHVRGNPFIQQIIDGAMAAGKDLGVKVEATGPVGFDANAQLQMVEDLLASGADGIATSIPGESMVKRLNQIAKSKPVVSFNIRSKNLVAPYVGERSVASGRILGEMIGTKLGGGRASGKVIIGICAPGFPVLENRAKGIKAGLRKVAPKLDVKGPFDVKVAANENYAQWEQLLAANPDVKAMIGTCAPDVESLGKLNRATGNKFVAGGYDLTAGNLAAIKRNYAFVTLGQNPFVQGYLPIKMIVDQLRTGKKLKVGFIDSGTEIVTASGGIMPYGLGKIPFSKVEKLGKNATAMRLFYTPLVKTGKLANYGKALEPLANEAK